MAASKIAIFERVFLIAYLLFWFYWLWSPYGSVVMGRQYSKREYGFIGYYSIETYNGVTTGRIIPSGLCWTIAVNAGIAAFCVYGMRSTRAAKKGIGGNP